MVTAPSTASLPFSSRGIIATQCTALLQRDWGLHAGDFLHQQRPDNAWTEHQIRQEAMGNGMWGLQGARLLGKEHNHKLLVECAEPCPGWQACCRGQPERAIILWGGGNYLELLMVFFLAVLRNGTVSQAWPWKGLHMAKRLCWSISHVSATPRAWNCPLSVFSSHVILQVSPLSSILASVFLAIIWTALHYGLGNKPLTTWSGFSHHHITELQNSWG